MKVNSDAVVTGTAASLQAQVPGFVFKGTGFYRNPTTFYIVIADGAPPDPWLATWPDSQTFHLYGYSTPMSSTIYGQPAEPPLRS